MPVVWVAKVDGIHDPQGRPATADVWMLFHDNGRVTWEPATELTVSGGGSSGSDARRELRRVRVPPSVKAARDVYAAGKPTLTTDDVEGTFPGERLEDGSPGLPVFKPAGLPPIIPKPRPIPDPEPEPDPEPDPVEDIPPGAEGAR